MSDYNVEVFISMKPDPKIPEEVQIVASVSDCPMLEIIAAIVRAMHDNEILRLALTTAVHAYCDPETQEVLNDPDN